MTIEFIRNVLMWCFIINAGMIMFWFIIITACGNLVYRLHSKLFKVSREQFDAIHYAGIVFYKIVIFVLFVIPYVAIALAG